MPSVPLSVTSSVALDGSGNGTIRLGPVSAREIWNPENAHVQVTGPVTNEAVCTIYVGNTATQGNFRDASQSGSTGDSTDRVNSSVVHCGEYIWAVWTGGDANRQATLVVTGSKTV